MSRVHGRICVILFIITVMVVAMPLFSNGGKAFAGKGKPAKVAGLKTTVKKNKVTVKWKKAKNATKYKVRVQVKNGKKWTGYTAAGTKSTSYSFKGEAGTTYRIRVRGATEDNAGPWSGWKTAKTKGSSKVNKKPVPVKNIKVKENKHGLTVSWNKPNTYGAKITSYQVTVRRKCTPGEVKQLRGRDIKIDSKVLRGSKTSVKMCEHVEMTKETLEQKSEYQVQVAYEYEDPKKDIDGSKSSDWKDFGIRTGWSEHDLKLIKSVEATWDDKGYKQYKCSICGHKEKEEVPYVITEKDDERICNNIMAMKEKYPHGTKWGEEEGACSGYASMITRECLPKAPGEGRMHHDLDRVHPGDQIIWDNQWGGHVIVVVRVEENGIYCTDGNASGKVRWYLWGRETLLNQDNYPNLRIFTRCHPVPEE